MVLNIAVISSFVLTLLLLALLFIGAIKNKPMGFRLLSTLLSLILFITFAYIKFSPDMQNKDDKKSSAISTDQPRTNSVPETSSKNQTQSSPAANNKFAKLGELSQFKQLSDGWSGPTVTSDNFDMYSDKSNTWYVYCDAGTSNVRKIAVQLDRITDKSIRFVANKYRMVDKQYPDEPMSTLATIALQKYLDGYGKQLYDAHDQGHHFIVNTPKAIIIMYDDPDK